MSQENNKDKIQEIDEEIESLDLNTQKALSLIEMGVAKEAAFEDAFGNLNKIEKIVKEAYDLEDSIIADIAKEKFIEAMSNFEEKIKFL
ncbi:hypothetical protein MOB65_20280 [Bacillus inaquosorum]|uniref:hypothetical protein n=1 Tax=Bacillus inaquosorum TaxID=483913 RepID=UPI00227E2663|nr:hypothetical protein [Bacillus inaquosorum]MCY7911196.1 hypothetical protein [Bacillus inaquosorum]